MYLQNIGFSKSIKIRLWKIIFNNINNIDIYRDDDAGRRLLIRHYDCIISKISNYNLFKPTIVLKIQYHFIMIINIALNKICIL